MRRVLCTLLLLIATGGRASAAEPFDVAQFMKTLHDEPPPAKAEDLFTLGTPKPNVHQSLPCFSADQSRVGIMFENNFVYVWDTKTGERVSPVNYRAPGKITSLALSSTGKYVLIGREKDNALVGESDAVKVAAVLKGFTSPAVAAAITDDDKYAVFCEKSGDILRFPLLGGEPERFAKAKEDTEDYDFFRILPGGKRVVFGSHKQKLLRMVVLPDEPGQEVESVAMSVEEYRTTGVALSSEYLLYSQSHDFYLRKRHDVKGASWMQSWRVWASWMSVSSDDQRLTMVSHNGIVNMRSMFACGLPRQFSLGHEVRDCAIARDGRLLIVVDDKNRLLLKRLPEDFEAPAVRIGRSLHKLLADKDYEALEAIFQQCEKDTTPFRWAPNQTPYHELCYLLATPPGAPLKYAGLKDAINAWAKERPRALPPRIMQTQEEIRLAWQNRGSGTADTVTFFGALGFEGRIENAEKIIVPVCDLETPPPMAFSLLFTVAMAQQWDDERLDPYVEKLLSLSPRAIDAHFAQAMALLPRWGGAPEDLNRYATRVADTIGGDEGDGIYARFAMAQRFLHHHDKIFAGTGLDYRRVRQGLIYLAKNAPDGKHAACFGAWFAVHSADNDGLKEFCELIKDDDFNLIWPVELIHYEGDRRVIQQQIAALKKLPMGK
jgi:hypothetical protein